MFRHLNHTLSAAVAALATACLALPASAGFTTGDIYVLSKTLSVPNNPAGYREGLARVNPQTGQTTVFPFPTGTIVDDNGTYDPYRDRILAPISQTQIMTIASDGTRSTIVLSQGAYPYRFAPTGGGRVYFTSNGGNLGYIDAGNVRHDVMNAAGTQAFAIANFATPNARLMYVAANNSLILAETPFQGATRARRFTLSPDGTRVTAESAPSTFAVTPNGTEDVCGISAGPNGSIFIKVDTYESFAAPRMLLLNPQSMQFSIFATSDYPMDLTESAGSYSSARGQAVVLERGTESLRAFSAGAVGAGTVFCPGITGPGGYNATVISIGDTVSGSPVSCPSDISHDNVVGVSDLLAVINNWGACPQPCPPSCAADIVANCAVDVNDLLSLINHWGPCP